MTEIDRTGTRDNDDQIEVYQAGSRLKGGWSKRMSTSRYING